MQMIAASRLRSAQKSLSYARSFEFDGFYRVYSYLKEKIKNSKVAEFINSAKNTQFTTK